MKGCAGVEVDGIPAECKFQWQIAQSAEPEAVACPYITQVIFRNRKNHKRRLLRVEKAALLISSMMTENRLFCQLVPVII